MLVVILWLMLLSFVSPFFLAVFLRLRRPKSPTVAFFHPYCDAGGGGERVLWCAIDLIQKRWPKVKCAIYTGDSASSKDIIDRVKTRFDIELKHEVEFVRLSNRRWVEAENYPHFTMILQSVGSIGLGFEALLRLSPHVFFDSMGYAFTYPLANYLSGSTVVAYTHYPTISKDMLEAVQRMRPNYNNSGVVATSQVLTQGKMVYYQIFAYLYGLCGRCASKGMVNSSWTMGHIKDIWKIQPHLVYPPCHISYFQQLPLLKPASSQLHMLSIAQFRPEKDHALQIRAISVYKQNNPGVEVHLHIAGSCRGHADEQRVVALRRLVDELKLGDSVSFHVNVSFGELTELMRLCSVGLHTMWNEHFGISVVEFMAAGIVPIAHNSGGPKADIVNHGVSGFLASTPEEYADCIKKFVALGASSQLKMMTEARKSSKRFSTENFEEKTAACLQSILNKFC